MGGGKSTFYDIPITSDKERYSEKKVTSPEFDGQRKELQVLIDQEMAKPPLYDGAIKVNDVADTAKPEKGQKSKAGKKRQETTEEMLPENDE